MENSKLPTEQESIENFAKWNNDLEVRYIVGCDPYNKDPDDIEVEVFYLTGGQVIARFEEHLTDEQKEDIAAHSQRYKKMSNR